MSQPEFEISIQPNGQVKVLVKGVSGRTCLNYADMIAEIVGKEVQRELTSEYYEQDTGVRIQAKQHRK